MIPFGVLKFKGDQALADRIVGRTMELIKDRRISVTVALWLDPINPELLDVCLVGHAADVETVKELNRLHELEAS